MLEWKKRKSVAVYACTCTVTGLISDFRLSIAIMCRTTSNTQPAPYTVRHVAHAMAHISVQFEQNDQNDSGNPRIQVIQNECTQHQIHSIMQQIPLEASIFNLKRSVSLCRSLSLFLFFFAALLVLAVRLNEMHKSLR